MKDVRRFYADRLSKVGFLTCADVKEGRESVSKMTPAYQASSFAMAASLLASGSGTTETPILDVGCGAGELLPYLRGLDWQGQYIGVDIVEGFVAGCADHYASDANAKFLCGDFTDRKFRKSIGPVHTVMSLSVFGLVDRPSFIRELVESCYDTAEAQYLFTCNSKHGYGVPSNRSTMIYDPHETLTMALGFTSKLEMLHRTFESNYALMAWRLDK